MFTFFNSDVHFWLTQISLLHNQFHVSLHSEISEIMSDKKDFSEKSEKLIENFQEQNRILDNFLKRLNTEYQQKFDSNKESDDKTEKKEKFKNK